MTIESEHDVEALKVIGKIVSDTLKLMIQEARAGMTTFELDQIGKKYLEKNGATSAPIKMYNFPGSTCISVNENIAHGIPNQTILRKGDIVNIDVSAELGGYFADTGGSFVIGTPTKLQTKVMKAAREALEMGLKVAKAGEKINLIGKAIEETAEKYNLVVIENLGSHGVGRALHEAPEFIAPYFDAKDKRILKEGQVITIEPFLSSKTSWVEEANDGWTLYGENGNVAAQYEHTLIITKDNPIIVT